LGREAPGAGLSKLHNVTEGKSDRRLGERSSTLTIAVGGSLVTVRTPRRGDPPPPPKALAKREAITEWSAKSRMALKCALAKLKRDELGQALFLTLTYPGEFPAPDDHAIYKNHLRVFNQALARAFGACGFWKLEFQSRGAAHFHLIIFGLEGQDIEALRQWVSQRWFDIVGSGDERHRRAGTQVDKAKSINGAMSYLTKYISKDDQTRPGNFTGRYWGRFNAQALPVCPMESIDLTEREGIVALRWARRITKKHVENSRWNAALRRPGHLFNERDGWSRLAVEQAYKGPRRPLMTVQRVGFKADDQWVPAGAVSWHWCAGAKGIFSMPCRYKARNNSTARLIVDADRLRADVERARRLGLFDRPACEAGRAPAKTDRYPMREAGVGSRRGPRQFVPTVGETQRAAPAAARWSNLRGGCLDAAPASGEPSAWTGKELCPF